MYWRSIPIVAQRAIVAVLLALFTITSSWLLPALSSFTRFQSSGNAYSARPQEQLIPFSHLSVSYAAPRSGGARAAPAIVDDAVILLDVTGSMLGEGPDSRARNIWDKTLDAVLDIVDRLAPQTNLALVPFSNGPEWRRISPEPVEVGGKLVPRQLGGDADREKFKAELRNLVADGQATWLYESLEYSLTQLRRWREEDAGRTHRQALFLYTDGIDNGPHGQLGMDGIVQLIQTLKGDNRSLYFVYNDLAGYLSLEQKARLAEIGVTVTVGPPTSNVEMVTEKLDFGELSASGGDVGREVSFRSGFADVWGRPVRLRIEAAGSKPPVALRAETAQLREQITVVLRPAGSLSAGQHQARLIVEPVDGAFNFIPRNAVDLTFISVAAPTAVAEPAPEPTPPPRLSIIDGVPDLLLFLGLLALVVIGAAGTLWWLELWPFSHPVPTMQVIWKRGQEPTRAGEEGVRVRTIKPARSRAAEEWRIGVEGFINLTDGGETIRPSHARVVYGGRKRHGFKLVPMEGEVKVYGKTVPPNGLGLIDGTTFVIGPYHFRFESSDGADHRRGVNGFSSG